MNLLLQRSLIAFAVATPTVAAAQVPVSPNAPVAPTNLNPGGTGTQGPAAPAPTAPAKPNVVIVGPNGVVPDDGQPAGPGRYYTGGGGGVVEDDPGVVHSGALPELHVVRTGDTLWDICWYYFNDPWQWPKVWSYNAQITNPHWIYPGDLVRLLPRGMFAQQDPGKITPDPEKGPEKAPDNLPPPQRRTEVSTKQVAFVEKTDLDNSITIEGAVDEKALLGPGDSVYLKYPEGKPPQVGQRYSIYTPGNPVKQGKKEVGSYVRILGSLEVQSVKQDKRARGVILEANKEIERGAKVGPLVKTFRNVTPTPVKVDAQGTIVAMLKHDQLIGQGEVVFIDLGRASGVEVGNRMFVVRRGDAFPKKMDPEIGHDDRRYPARALGEVIVVEVGDKLSIGLVTLSVQEMSTGDFVMMQKAQ
ncbi:MAG: LysM peptidoglycan-binding domain-containing protein [Deltaproteobacteria bacterium]|nr:LysM peptidoglycan-binding domain-containing protein [Deltaproteobacteria bacterium]